MESARSESGSQSSVSMPVYELINSIQRLPAAEVEQLKSVLESFNSHRDGWVADESGVRASVNTLSVREKDVLTLIASGYTRREIGDALCVSSNTAASHIASIYRKLGIGTIAEATHVAIRHGVVKLM